MGKALSAVINVVLLIGIISMMFMPISTVMALHTDAPVPDPPDGSHCHGEPRSPWRHVPETDAGPFGGDIDVNGNDFICFNGKSNMFQDDVLPRR